MRDYLTTKVPFRIKMILTDNQYEHGGYTADEKGEDDGENNYEFHSGKSCCTPKLVLKGWFTLYCVQVLIHIIVKIFLVILFISIL